MIFSRNRSLGIDISDKQITMILAEKQEGKAVILRKVTAEVPDGAIQQGRIVDGNALGKAIKQMKSQNGLCFEQAHLSLVANPVLCQIFDMPRPLPANMSQYLQEKIRYYARMPGNEATFDYCGLKPIRQDNQKRSLVYAADTSGMKGLLTYLEYAGIEIKTVEPCELAAARSYFSQTREETNKRCIVACYRHGQLNLCVLKDGKIENVRVKEARVEEVLAEIEEVLTYYEMEVGVGDCDCQMQFLCDDEILKAVDTASLSARHKGIEFRCHGVCDGQGGDGEISAAYGLALRSFDEYGFTANVNLLPENLLSLRRNSKRMMTSLNAATLILLVMMAGSSFLLRLSNNMADAAKGNTVMIRQQNIGGVLQTDKQLSGEIETITKDVDNAEDAIDHDEYIEWSGIIAAVVRALPESVQMSRFYNVGGGRVVIEGLALEHNSLPAFAEKLEESEMVTSAKISSTYRSSVNGLVEYVINCEIKSK